MISGTVPDCLRLCLCRSCHHARLPVAGFVFRTRDPAASLEPRGPTQGGPGGRSGGQRHGLGHARPEVGEEGAGGAPHALAASKRVIR